MMTLTWKVWCGSCCVKLFLFSSSHVQTCPLPAKEVWASPVRSKLLANLHYQKKPITHVEHRNA
jgi:hypothetical protein